MWSLFGKYICEYYSKNDSLYFISAININVSRLPVPFTWIWLSHWSHICWILHTSFVSHTNLAINTKIEFLRYFLKKKGWHWNLLLVFISVCFVWLKFMAQNISYSAVMKMREMTGYKKLVQLFVNSILW